MAQKPIKPYLSVIITGRPECVQTFVDRWMEPAGRYGLEFELLPASCDVGAINAAIREAHGDFILVTHSNAAFSAELMQFLAARRLEPARLYRIDTHLVSDSIDHVTAICRREGTFALTADEDVHFGAGWFPSESAAGVGPFRWIENNAEVVLRMPSGGRMLALEFEPGPGIGESPAVLRALDADGVEVAQWTVTGRIRTELAVPPPRQGDLQRIRFVVDGGGLPVLDDPRILNLRFFRCDWVERETATAPERGFSDLARENWPTVARLMTSMRAASGSVAVLRRGAGDFKAAVRLLGARGSDIFTSGEEFRFGPGWHGVETAAGERFRWAAQNAELLLRITQPGYELRMLVEPGPGLAYRPFTLIVRDGVTEIARRDIKGLTWIQFPVAYPADAVVKLVFSAEGDGAATAGDARVLNFRVLACGGESGSAAAAAVDIHSCWPSLRLDEQPATDWSAVRVTDLGKPAFLHTNGAADFVLMSRDDWHEVRGYPELDAPAARLATLLCYTAHFAGVREEILRQPLRLYRFENREPQPQVASCLAAAELQQLIVQMRRMRAPVIYNAWPAGPKNTSGPYLSVVIAARNDNHGGNMLGRMQAFFNAWLSQSSQYGVDSEIVVVEWNPPAGSPKLIDAIEWPRGPHSCQVRFVEVPPELHQKFPHADAVPLHQMIAKNVGIRRARGEFVLATNLDIVFSPELMQFLAARRLEPRRMYRMDRYDVSREIPAAAGVDELLAFCQSHLLRVFTAEGGFDLDDCGRRQLEADDIVAPDDGIRFGPGWYKPEVYDAERFRWIADEAEMLLTRTGRLAIDVDNGPSAGGAGVGVEVVSLEGAIVGSGVVKGRCRLLVDVPESLAAGFRLRVLGGGVPLTRDLRMLNVRVFGLRWASSSRQDAAVELVRTGPAKNWNTFVQAPSPQAPCMRDAAYLHTNACGDFTILARDDWFALRGYPEFPIWPMHIDALLCYEAHHAGVREVVLGEPMRMFHVEHLTGAGWTPEGEEARLRRIARKQVPAMEYDEVEKWVDRMRRFNAPIIVTRGNWGLAGEDLPERIVER